MRSAAGSGRAASSNAPSARSRKQSFTGRSSGLLVEVELHRRRRVRARLGGEIGFLAEAEDAGEEDRGHALDGGVVVAGEVVEAAALDADAVLGALQLRLQFLEVGRGLE